MKGEQELLLFVSVFLFLGVLFSPIVNGISSEERLFDSFIKKYGRTYRNGSAEHNKRFKIFKESLARHDRLNSYRNHPEDAFFGVTKFADLTPEEFEATYLQQKPEMPAPHRSLSANFKTEGDDALFQSSIPKKFNLRDNKPPVLSEVKTQGKCGSCWAFCVVECLETQHAMMKHGTLYDLSVQQVMDCNSASSDKGCNGGSLGSTLQWLNSTKEKITLAKYYPYKSRTESCDYVTAKPGLVYVQNFSNSAYVGNEDQMLSILYKHGPLAAAVDAKYFNDYLGGIIQHHCSPRILNHAVQIVGYDRTGEIPYYIVRNSWGEDWGHSGYLYIKIGGDVCGIARDVGTVTTN